MSGSPTPGSPIAGAAPAFAPPGWYSTGSRGLSRWWDGSRWTDHMARPSGVFDARSYRRMLVTMMIVWPALALTYLIVFVAFGVMWGWNIVLLTSMGLPAIAFVIGAVIVVVLARGRLLEVPLAADLVAPGRAV
jgi:hypothetical protein